MIKKIFLFFKEIFSRGEKCYEDCLFCAKKLTGSQRKFCSDKCTGAYYRYIEKFGQEPRKSKPNAKLRGQYLNNINGIKDRAKAQAIAYKIKNLNGKCYLCQVKKAAHRHHPDYNNPEFVIPLCIGCHRRLHVILNISIREDK